MKLSDCKYGILVQSTATHSQVGMVVGITNNVALTASSDMYDPERAIPLVQWQSGKTYGIHHSNLRAYKE